MEMQYREAVGRRRSSVLLLADEPFRRAGLIPGIPATSLPAPGKRLTFLQRPASDLHLLLNPCILGFLDSSLVTWHGSVRAGSARDGKRKRVNGNANAPKDTHANPSAGRMFTGATVHHVRDEHASFLAHKHVPAAEADSYTQVNVAAFSLQLFTK